MRNVRCLWLYKASDLNRLACNGVDPADTRNRFTVPVQSMVLLSVCQIIPCTEHAASSIEQVVPWTV
jgi:hypothetical protein